MPRAMSWQWNYSVTVLVLKDLFINNARGTIVLLLCAPFYGIIALRTVDGGEQTSGTHLVKLVTTPSREA